MQRTTGTTLHRADDAAGPVAAGYGAPRLPGRRLRQARRLRLYAGAFLGVALLALVIALIAANAHAVELDWLVGTSRTSLVWVLLAAGIGGWVIGLSTAGLVRHRSRRPRHRR